ncbi:MAG: hypothetical protein A2Y82_01140 [Candidatus Buchananbacteria bacterium RBG_13_36_9]|uniref:Uncharacterized protein n=1 Tax=Candidatus Buchananbacteria bacterium RBG_13_36_9 TaxID=1797530 RepID=A0A1G1XPR6_9BACT|nr:MAG: hypothetical protein A2Y82_01140 [Candidatus Buchananbacteria bacterium RBG_13_36_9]
MFLKIFGLILVVVGPLLVIKAEWFLENFGRIEWAEAHLGTEGGTRLFYKLLGIIFIFFGLTMIFNLFGGIVTWVFSPLLPK